MPRIAIQDHMLPGRDIEERFANAAEFGFDGIELTLAGDTDLEKLVTRARRAAGESGVAVASLCTSGDHDPLHPVSILRKRRFAGLTTLLEAANALGASGVVSVPLRPGLVPYEDDPNEAIHALTEDAVEAFRAWAETLPDSGNAALFLEPLNRFEAKFLTRVGQAAAFARRIDSPRIRVLGDIFHMNIEEENAAGALTGAGSMLGHMHLAENTRLLPGTGAFRFGEVFDALKEISYRGWLALECFPPLGRALIRDPAVELPATLAFLRMQWAGR
jgi:sugar phosphate isomerase/epimerase